MNGRIVRVLLWVLAVIVPGGLVMLALWASAQGVRARMSMRPPALARGADGRAQVG